MSQRGDDSKQARSARDAEIDSAMQRFFDLSAADQLRAYEQMRDFLGASAPAQTAEDHELEQRRESLAALEQVREHLGLEGKAPTVKEFDRVAHELDLGWTARRVGEVWGRWRFACEALLGERPRLTAVQQSLQHRFSGRRRRYEDYVTALRLWLASDPPLVRMNEYTLWTRQFNDTLADGQMPLPRAETITSLLQITWPEAVRWGRGEITFAEAAKRRPWSRQDWSSGPHDLVGLGTAAEILGLGGSSCRHHSYKPNFPTPVVVFARGQGVRAWLRKDIESYRDTGKAPKRRRDQWRAQYYEVGELASLIGVLPLSILTKQGHAPGPTGCAGGVFYWLKRDADRWIRENRELIDKRLKRGHMKALDRRPNARRAKQTRTRA